MPNYRLTYEGESVVVWARTEWDAEDEAIALWGDYPDNLEVVE